MPAAVDSVVASFPSTANTTSSGARSVGTTAVGDVLCAIVVGGGVGNTLGFSDNEGHTWTASTEVENSTTTAITTQLFMTTVVTPPATVTATKAPTGGLAFTLLRLTGVTLSGFVQNTGSGSHTTVTSGSVSVPAGSLSIFGAGVRNDATVSDPFSWTDESLVASTGSGNPRAASALSLLSASAETVSPSITYSAPGGFATVVVNFAALAEEYEGTMAQTMPSFTQSATGTHVAPGFVGTATQVMEAFTQAIVGASALPSYTGTIAQTLAAFTQDIAGAAALLTPGAQLYTYEDTDGEPYWSTVAPGDLFWYLDTDGEPYLSETGPGNVLWYADTDGVPYFVVPPAFVGTMAQSFTAFTQAAAGATVPPAFTGEVTQTLSAFTQQAVGTRRPAPIVAVVTQTMPSFSQSALAKFGHASGAISVQIMSPFSQSITGTVAEPTLAALTAQMLIYEARRKRARKARRWRDPAWEIHHGLPPDDIMRWYGR